MAANVDGRREDWYVILDETLPVIRAALIAYYEFEEYEATAFEDTLCVWFHRVSRRSGFETRSANELREQLLFVACKYARAFQLPRFQAAPGAPSGRAMELGRSAEDVAVELLARIQHGAQ